MLGLMTDCTKRFKVDVNYTQAYYAVEDDRASKHVQAVRTLDIQCLLPTSMCSDRDETSKRKFGGVIVCGMGGI